MAAPMPEEPPQTKTPRPSKQSVGQIAAASSPDELIDKFLSEPDRGEMPAAHLYLGKDVFIPCRFPPRVHVVHDPVNLEIGNHLVHILGHNKRVRFSGRLEDI